MATDGRLDESAPPSVGAVLYDPVDGARVAVVAMVAPQLVCRWEKYTQYISLVEQAGVLMGIQYFADRLRHRDLVLFQDNSAVLAGLCKGTSAHPELDQGAAVVHLLLAALTVRLWAEYIPSKANWADEPSRQLQNSPWLKKHGFQVVTGHTASWPYVNDLADIPGQIQAAIESGVGIGAALGQIPTPLECSSHRATIPKSSPARVS
jgi:hypothetical protein